MTYLKSAFSYAGAKFSILEQIFQYFPSPETVSTFYDVFCGGGSVFINSNYKNIVANDIIKPLIDFYNELKYKNFDEIETNLSKFILDKSDKEGYMLSREEFNKCQNPYHFFCLVQSCQNNLLRFNKQGKFNQTWGNRAINKNTWEKLLAYHIKLKTQNVEFTNVNFYDLIDRISFDKNVLVYLDPPYFLSEAGYNAFWSKELENKLYNFIDILNNNQIRFIFSNVSEHKGQINPFMYRLKKYNIINIEHGYEKVSRKSTGITQEILVKNF